ncbi:MAG: DNA-binding protein [Deltaproteobacteria bacterium RIFCSPLOWO2_01_44_7]|nr:MAG: DNA-binding protein [Deltaproteobacteria bacterium RIFCSPHIGHO2_01_FULL_43_49]OGQ15998.1 MAG: DNA-binding protein [Deltaproteobacteria bacterium RIFCSPHIGHO2_02_FULL_44_53]OGQ28955.1 MAG: DNA-binding protein [Deltaproteobacteria bacterium RIFCSPHIGHO2_12_FULL_44_21]OGQ33174.1 MAG: DNA-binding protein [Deltaproteobacteria bacterium RIFCSPLOWO2_01_FULL_45_74]OGQ41628.1 MAG: DNA-binding protein [Deltaproteobacteria bacterium RIFCSPLOWO2_01_44_7]OGQ42270.1 MAG: DNA-binding protein [Deltapr
MLKNLKEFLKQKRKEIKLTQPELASKAGVGLRFIRDMEQGKKALRLDKVNQVLSLFGYVMAPVNHRDLEGEDETR